MGVLSVLRDSEDIAADTGTTDSVALISCNNCIRGCGAGGEMHLPRIAKELEALGVRIEDVILITNPCSRGYLENRDLSSAVDSTVIFACPGTQAAFSTLHPNVRVVAGVESLGLMINSKAKGRIKLVMPFHGYEDLAGAEFKAGDTSVRFDDQLLSLNQAKEVTA